MTAPSGPGRGNRTRATRLRWTLRAVQGAALLLLATASTCRPPASDPRAGRDVRPTSESIDSLRALGRYDAALTAARARLRAIDRARVVPRWMRDDARREVTTLVRIAALPESLRRALAMADAATARAHSLEVQGDAIGAIELTESQLAIRRRCLGPEHPDIAASLSALARRVYGQGRFNQAHELDVEALAMRRRILGERHPDVAESLDQLGLDLKPASLGRGESMRLYRQALNLRSELLGPDSPEAMATLMNIANLHRMGREPDSALAIFRRVLAHRRQSRGPDHELTGDVLFSMAMTLTPRGAWSEAEPLLREAVACARAQGPGARLSLARCLNAQGLALRHLDRLAEAESVLTEAGNLLEELRKGALPGLGRPIMFPLVSYGFLAATQLERGRPLDAWNSVERSLARALIETLGNRGAIDTTGWWQDALGRVQRALPEDAALIGWLALRPGAAAEEYPFWCYCIRRTGPPHWCRVDAPSAGATRAADLSLDELSRELRRNGSWPLRVDDTGEITRLGRAAYDQRFSPIEPWLGGVKRLVVVSPDLLHGAVVEAFVDSMGRSLSDRFAITYAPSALLYAHAVASAPERSSPETWRALLVGDPDPARAPGAPPPPRLAAAEAEVRDIASLIRSPALLLGRDASEQRLRDLAASGGLRNFQIIHFATHASIDPVWNGRSALLLSPLSPGPATARGGPDSAGRIAVDEIAASWRLDADLVTLAACRSVLGPASTTEGYLGLHQALLGAGARHVLVSVWRVDDGATALLMSHFYRTLLTPALPGSHGHREPGDVAGALAEARRWLSRWRAPDGTTPYAHPVYWAGFILVCGGGAGRAQPPAAADRSPS